MEATVLYGARDVRFDDRPEPTSRTWIYGDPT